ncbi:MAG: hypothetical protein QW728_08025 [Thermoplasmata archaeon]
MEADGLIKFIVFNNAGNALTLYLNVYLDITPPAATTQFLIRRDTNDGAGVTPDIGYEDDRNVLLEWQPCSDLGTNRSGIRGYYIEANTAIGSPPFSTMSVGYSNNSTWHRFVFTVPNDGTFNFTIWTIDNVGNPSGLVVAIVEGTIITSVVVDTGQPTGLVLSVNEIEGADFIHYVSSNNTFYYSANNAKFILTATANPSISGAWYVVLPPAFSTTGTDNDYSSPFSRQYNISSTDTTSGNITVYFYNHAGNVGSANITIFKDTTPPAFTDYYVIEYSDYLWWDNSSKVLWHSSRMGSNPQAVTIVPYGISDNGTGQAGVNRVTYGLVFNEQGQRTPWDFNFTYYVTGSETDNNITVNITVYDNVSNSRTLSFTVKYDNTPPVIPWADIIENSPYLYRKDNTTFYYGDKMGSVGQNLTLRGYVNENPDGAGLDNITVPAFGTETSRVVSYTGFSGVWSWSWNVTSNYTTPNGTITFIIKDHVGNSVTQSFTFYRDVYAPVSAISPIERYYTVYIISLSWSGSDDAGGSGLCAEGVYDLIYSDNYGFNVTYFDKTYITYINNFGGQDGHYYRFKTQAIDNCGNYEVKTGWDTETTFDMTLPVSRCWTDSPQYWNQPVFTVFWNFSDDPPMPGLIPSGIAAVRVQYRTYNVNTGALTGWRIWLNDVKGNSSAQFAGEHGYRYDFRTVAIDNASNMELPPEDGDFSIEIDLVAPLPPVLIAPANNSVIAEDDVANHTALINFLWGNTSRSPLGNFTFELYKQDSGGSYALQENLTFAATGMSQVLSYGNYSWRVKAIDKAMNWGNWSAVFYFRIDRLPVVGSISVNGSRPLVDNRTISWTETDPDVWEITSLKASVYVGQTGVPGSQNLTDGWTAVAVNIPYPTTSVNWDTSLFPDGEYFIMVVVSDGFVVGYNISTNFTVKNYNIQLMVEGENDVWAYPGERVNFTIRASNDGKFTYTLDISIDQIAGWTSSVSMQSITLANGTYQMFNATIVVPLDAKAADYKSFYITGVYPGNTNVRTATYVTIHVRQTFNISWIEPAMVKGNPDQRMTLNFTLNNTGNGWDRFNISAYSDLGWNVTLYVRLNNSLDYTIGNFTDGIYSFETTIILVDVDIPSSALADEICNISLRVHSVHGGFEYSLRGVAKVGVNLIPNLQLLVPLQVGVMPDSVQNFTITIRNLGNGADTFHLNYSYGGYSGLGTIDYRWPVSFGENEVFIGRLGIKEINVSVVVPPCVPKNGDLILLFNASSMSNSSVFVQTPTGVRLLVLEAVRVSLNANSTHIQALPGTSATVSIELRNTGNSIGEVPFELQVLSGPQWQFALNPYGTVLLTPNSTEVYSLNVTLPAGLEAGSIYTFVLEGYDLSRNAVSTVEVAVEVSQQSAISSTVPENIRGNKGSTIEVPISIVNTGNGLDSFTLSCEYPAGFSGAILKNSQQYSSTGILQRNATDGFVLSINIPDNAEGTTAYTLVLSLTSGTTNAVITIPVNVTVNANPFANLSLDKLRYNPGENVVLTAGTSSDIDGYITVFSWNTTEHPPAVNTTRADESVSFVFTTPGQHTIYLMTIDNEGARGFASLTITINAPPALVKLEPQPGALSSSDEKSTTFTVQAEDPDKSGTVTYTWYLDGRKIDGADGPTYTFKPAWYDDKEHNVTLVVSDGEANTTTSWTIKVNPNTSITAEKNRTKLCGGIIALLLLVIVAVLLVLGVRRMREERKKREEEALLTQPAPPPEGVVDSYETQLAKEDIEKEAAQAQTSTSGATAEGATAATPAGTEQTAAAAVLDTSDIDALLAEEPVKERKKTITIVREEVSDEKLKEEELKDIFSEEGLETEEDAKMEIKLGAEEEEQNQFEVKIFTPGTPTVIEHGESAPTAPAPSESPEVHSGETQMSSMSSQDSIDNTPEIDLELTTPAIRKAPVIIISQDTPASPTEAPLPAEEATAPTPGGAIEEGLHSQVLSSEVASTLEIPAIEPTPSSRKPRIVIVSETPGPAERSGQSAATTAATESTSTQKSKPKIVSETTSEVTASDEDLTLDDIEIPEDYISSSRKPIKILPTQESEAGTEEIKTAGEEKEWFPQPKATGEIIYETPSPAPPSGEELDLEISVTRERKVPKIVSEEPPVQPPAPDTVPASPPPPTFTEVPPSPSVLESTPEDKSTDMVNGDFSIDYLLKECNTALDQISNLRKKDK